MVVERGAADGEPNLPLADELEAVNVDVDASADAETTPLGAVHTRAEFDEVVIWGHESGTDATSDPYVRAVEEWLAVADQVCSRLFSFLLFVTRKARFVLRIGTY